MDNNIETAETTNTPDTEVADKVGVSEVADTNTENEVQFNDGDGTEDAENNQSQSGDDDNKANDGEKPKEEEKSQKSNADYARERRKLEQEKALKKAKYDTIIDTLNGENPYTHEKMEDDADVEEYLTMREIEKSGKDPVADYSKFLKAKTKEQIKQKEVASSQEEWIKNDRKDFASKHPDVNLDNLVDDEMFKVFALGKVGKMSMDKIYTDYTAFANKIEERAKDRAAQVLANNAATPGKLSKEQIQPAKSFSEMSKSEFEKAIEKAKRGEFLN